MHDLMLQELRLFTDCGRCCRPLFIVDLETQRLAVTKQEIGLLQFRDSTGFGWSVSFCPALTPPGLCQLSQRRSASRSPSRRSACCSSARAQALAGA